MVKLGDVKQIFKMEPTGLPPKPNHTDALAIGEIAGLSLMGIGAIVLGRRRQSKKP